MNKVIRWPGLIAFIVVMALIIAPAYFFANSIAKSLIESQGSDLVGAKVDVREVKLGLSPAGIVIRGLDVANADEPMTNVVSIDNIHAQFDLLKAFMGQLIIKDMSVNGMEFGTARKTSGAITKKIKPEKPKEPSFVSEQLDKMVTRLPDSKEALEREPLLMDERHKNLEKSVEDKERRWKQLEESLPSNESLAIYQQRIADLQKQKPKSLADFKAMSEELKAIQKDIKNDQQTLQQAKNFLSVSSKELSADLKALKDAPKEDRDRLLSKYTLDEGGLANMSGLLFGADIQDKVETALYWYEKIAPFLASDDKDEEPKRERAKGRFILFPEANPYPSFLIENMAASARLEMGELSATAKDITHQQDVQNKPTTLHVGSEVLRNVKRLDVNAVFDYRVAKQGKSVADFIFDQVDIKNYKISSNKDMPLTLEQAVAQANGQLKLESNKLSGQLHSDFEQALFATGEGKGLMQYVNQAFAEINRFNLDVGVGGSLRSPKLNIRSDIDKQLKNSVERQLKQEIERFKQELEQQLNQRLDEYLAKLNLPGFDDEEMSLQDKLNNLDDLLKAKLDNFSEQQKQEVKEKADEAKDKAKDKVKDALKQKLKF